MFAHGLKDSDEFNYVSNISSLKTQNKSPVIILQSPESPFSVSKPEDDQDEKERSFVSTVFKKIEIVLCLVIIPCHTEKALTIRRSPLVPSLDCWPRARGMTPCSWGKRLSSKYGCLGASRGVPNFSAP